MNFDTLFTTITCAPKPVPNEIRPCTIALLGEAPGADEVAENKPFVGASGRFLWAILSGLGVRRQDVSVLNVCQHRPPNNHIDEFSWDGEEIQNGLVQLALDLEACAPHIIVCLGNTALRAMKGDNFTIDSWRGSLFEATFAAHKYKCIATYHPAGVLRQYSWLPLMRFDLLRAVEESKTKELVLPQRDLSYTHTVSEALDLISTMTVAGTPVSVDIEGGTSQLKCIGFSNDPRKGTTIPFVNSTGTSFFSLDDEMLLWPALARFLTDPTIPKVCQNYLYDGFVLPFSYKTPLRGIVDDAMVKHWELLSELEKGLAVTASIYTRQPHWKSDDMYDNSGERLWLGCAMDAAVTLEVNRELTRQHSNKHSAQRHYSFNLSLLPVLNYMQLRGVRIDYDKRSALIETIKREIYERQDAINTAATPYLCHTPLSEDRSAALATCAKICCYQRGTYILPKDLEKSPKAPWVDTISDIVSILERWPAVEPWERGKLNTLIENHLNVDSNKQMAELLYKRLALPTQYKKEHGRKTERVTTDALALLTLFRKTANPLVRDLLRLRNLNDQITGLDFTLVAGRCYTGYNAVGTETGRVAGYNSSARIGKNIQTETSKFKHIYVPDNETKWFFEVDLAGADGWTVAAHCARLGDRTMLDDYLAGIKPAKVIALMYDKGPEVARWNREALKEGCRSVSQKGWLYFASKRVQHGTNYGMQPSTMSDQILKDSWNKEGDPIFVEPTICGRLQQMYLTRYPAVKRWHSWCEAQLRATGQLVSASGHTRIFFGRRDDFGTVKEYLADEPQENTTYGTNLALLRLFHDAANRDSSNSLIIEPLFHRHDAFGGQFPKSAADFCVESIRSYFSNVLVIAGQTIIIPFEGGYGPSWGELIYPI